MKKLLLIFAFLVSTIAANAIKVTIYVKADTAPYLYGWYTVNGKETRINDKWPGKQMTQTANITYQQKDTVFWCQTFEVDASSFNIIFNDGGKVDTQGKYIDKSAKQTGNISNISSDRYFIYDGATKYTDITEEFGVVIPDVEIQSVALISELNGWDGMAQLFTEVEKDRKYTCNVDLTNATWPTGSEDYYRFKFLVNSSAYLDWNTAGMTKVDPNEWMEEDVSLGGGNIGIDVEEAGVQAFLFTLEFAGGKDIYQGWTLTVAEGTANIDAIQVVDASKAKPYNLSGQRVNNNYRGLVIQNGKKVMVK